MALSPPPPTSIARDEYSAADSARKRFLTKTRFPRFLSLPNLRSSRQAREPLPVSDEATLQEHTVDLQMIVLDQSKLEGTEDYQDKYEWAILYENQRGVTMFSTPYYSRLSLLPSDPSSFTIPNTPAKRSKQPPVSLDNYPLPDGTWRWVSKCWMIDMRSDSGEVQHDGFEYNWMFRTHNWRAEIGSFNAGGWVRRRRWVRLMMRPAKPRPEKDEIDPTTTAGSSTSELLARHHHSRGSSSTPSVTLSAPEDTWNFDTMWSNDVETNWTNCHALMKRLGRDGRKLELWKAWVGNYPLQRYVYDSTRRTGKMVRKQWTEDDAPLPSELEVQDGPPDDLIKRVKAPPKEDLMPLLRKYGDSLLRMFVFPDSRAEFLALLGEAGLLPELNVGLGIGSGASGVDFWSYASGLGT